MADILIWAFTIILFSCGLAGTLVPFLPGTIIISCGVLWQGIMGTVHLTWWQWLGFVPLIFAGLVIDKITGGVGARAFGSAKAGIIGALLGIIIAPFIMTPLLGLILGPFLGALVGEIIFSKKKLRPAMKAGAGATLGVISGIALEFLIGIMIISWFMLCYFVFPQ